MYVTDTGSVMNDRNLWYIFFKLSTNILFGNNLDKYVGQKNPILFILILDGFSSTSFGFCDTKK